jgi:hypothetical protein
VGRKASAVTPRADTGLGGPWDAGSKVDCKASDAVYDLSGNLAEWEDSCDVGGACRVRGGSHTSTRSGDLGCAADERQPKTTRSDEIGFRCCE